MKGAGQALPGDKPHMQVGGCSQGRQSPPSPQPCHSASALALELTFCPPAHVHFQHIKHDNAMGPPWEKSRQS